MIKVLTPSIPNELRHEEVALSDLIALFISDAIFAQRLPLPFSGTHSLAVSFPNKAKQHIKRLKADFSGSNKEFSKFLGELCNAQIQHLLSCESSPNSCFRPAQADFFRNLSCVKGSINIVEAATGIGKGRAMVAAALRDAVKKTTPVFVSVPSVNGLYQLAAELTHLLYDPFAVDLIGADPNHVSYAFVVGRANFFCPHRFSAIIDLVDIPSSKKIELKEWIRKGAKPLNSTKSFVKMCPNLAYLYEDLEVLCPELVKLSDLRLESYSDSPAQDIYKEMRQEAHEVDIVFVTHAMLGYDNTQKYIAAARGEEDKKTILPYAQSLYIDEAHLLENILLNLESVQFSPIIFRSLIAKSTMPKTIKTKITDLNNAAIELTKSSKKRFDKIWPSSWQTNSVDAISIAVIGIYTQVFALLEFSLKKQKKHTEKDREIHAQLLNNKVALKRIISKRQPIWIQVSPVRKWPKIEATPNNLNKKLAFLWQQTRFVALISATLYLPGPTGEPDASYISKSLYLPVEKVKTYPPIRPSWVTDPVELFTPADHKFFVPPSENDFAGNEKGYNKHYEMWLDNVTQILLQIAQDQKTGSLFLLNSYDLVKKLTAKLQEQLNERLLTQQQNTSFASLKTSFLGFAALGARPVLLGVGQAWTGLDLSSPSGDPLSDVVLVRLPFKPRTVNNKKGRNATAFDMRQGIGRLVRNDKCKDKKLWILDGRIFNDSTWYRPFQAILTPYMNRQTF